MEILEVYVGKMFRTPPLPGLAPENNVVIIIIIIIMMMMMIIIITKHCSEGVALPIARWQCHNAQKELHSPLPAGTEATQQKYECPLPVGGEVVHKLSFTAHYPQAVRQCTEGVPLPTALGWCQSAPKEFPCLLRVGIVAMHRRSSTAPWRHAT